MGEILKSATSNSYRGEKAKRTLCKMRNKIPNIKEAITDTKQIHLAPNIQDAKLALSPEHCPSSAEAQLRTWVSLEKQI